MGIKIYSRDHRDHGHGGATAASRLDFRLKFGEGVLIAVPLFVFLCHLLVLVERPSHLDKIIAELGSIRRFVGDPVPNNAGTRVLFIQTTDNGYGVFLSEVSSSHRRLIFEETVKGPGSTKSKETLLGWSPDDKVFAYSRFKDQWKQWEMVICDGDSGIEIVAVPINKYVADGDWMSSSSMVFSDNSDILYSIRLEGGRWVGPKWLKVSQKKAIQIEAGQIKDLTALESHTIGWRQENSLWKCTEDSEAPVPLLAAVTATMDNAGNTWYEQGFEPSDSTTGIPAHGAIFASQAHANHLYEMAPSYTDKNALVIDSVVTNGTLILKTAHIFTQLSFLASSANGVVAVDYVIHHADASVDTGTINIPDWSVGTSAAWVANGQVTVHGLKIKKMNSGSPKIYDVDIHLLNTKSPVTSIGFAYNSGKGRGAIFAVGGAITNQFQPIAIEGYNEDVVVERTFREDMSSASQMLKTTRNRSKDGSTFVVESIDGNAPAIWRHSAGSQAECIVANTEKPFRYAYCSPILPETCTNASGERLLYYVVAPVCDMARQKHPLVVAILGDGEMGYSWSPNYEAFANCGAYFVSVDRDNRDNSTWPDDALAVCNHLIDQGKVDTNRICLYGDSAGVGAVYVLVEKKPQMWRGAILFSPEELPIPWEVQGSRMFVDCGSSDRDLALRAPTFQNEAAERGIPVRLLVHPGLGHTFRLPAAERERIREAVIFFGEE